MIGLVLQTSHRSFSTDENLPYCHLPFRFPRIPYWFYLGVLSPVRKSEIKKLGKELKAASPKLEKLTRSESLGRWILDLYSRVEIENQVGKQMMKMLNDILRATMALERWYADEMLINLSKNMTGLSKDKYATMSQNIWLKDPFRIIYTKLQLHQTPLIPRQTFPQKESYLSSLNYLVPSLLIFSI